MTASGQLYFDWPAFIINDLKQCRKTDTVYEFDVNAQYKDQQITRTISFKSVYVQGFIEQKPCDDVMILRDCSGRVKLSNCTSATTDNDSIVKGAYCAVDGTLVRHTGLPEISCHKIINIKITQLSNDYLLQSWPFEVKDFKLHVLEILKPSL